MLHNSNKMVQCAVQKYEKLSTEITTYRDNIRYDTT